MNFFKRITNWFVSKFDQLLDKFRQESDVAVKITDKIKNIVLDTRPYIDILTDIIPGDLDDKIHDKIVDIVPKVAEKVAIANGILKANDKNSDALGAVIEYLKNTYPGVQQSFWIVFSGELNVALSDGKLSLSEGISLAQYVYQEIKNK